MSAQQPVSTTRKNHFEQVTASFNDKEQQFELVTASFNDKEKPVWAGHSQFQWQGETSLSQEESSFELVTSQFQWPWKNQFEPVTASFNKDFKPVSTTSLSWAASFKIRKTSFEPVSTTRKNGLSYYSQQSSENQEEPVWASYSQFQWQGKIRSEPVFWGTCLFVSCTTASFNNQEEPVWGSHSQFKWQEKTSLS